MSELSFYVTRVISRYDPAHGKDSHWTEYVNVTDEGDVIWLRETVNATRFSRGEAGAMVCALRAHKEVKSPVEDEYFSAELTVRPPL